MSTLTVTDNGNGTATLSGDPVVDNGDGTATAPGDVTGGVVSFTSDAGGLSWHTLNLNFADIEGDPLAGGTVFVSYDRTVRTPDMLVPNPAADGVAIPLVGMASVQVLSSDDPSLTADSAGFGIVVRVVWTDADANYQRKSKTYKAQVLTTDASTVNLSAKIGAQTVPAQLVDMSTVLANSNTAATDAAASAAAAINAANLVDAPPDNVIATAVNGAGTATQTALDGRYLKSASANTTIDAHLGGDATGLVAEVAAKIDATAAIPRPISTEVTYFVTPRGDDSHDGLTLMTAKASIPSALAAAGSAKPLIVLGIGSFALPVGAAFSSSTVIQGAGVGLTLITYSGSSVAFGPSTPGARTYSHSISGLSLYGAPTAGSVGIDLTSMSSVSVQDVLVSGFETGIKIGSTIDGGAVYNNFVNVTAQNCTTGILVGASGSNSNRFFGCRANNCTTGLQIQNSNATTWIGGQIESCTTGASVEGTTANKTAMTMIAFTRFENNATAWTVTSSNVTNTQILFPAIFGTYTFSDSGTRTTHWGNLNTTELQPSAVASADGSWKFQRTVSGGTSLPALVVEDAVTSTGTPVTVQANTGRHGGSFFRGVYNGNVVFDAKADGSITMGSGTSTQRPSAPQAGAMWFDTTVHKPIFYNGTGWIDATGTSV